MKFRHHVKHGLRGALLGVSVASVTVGFILGLFILTWGWHRFLLDFWPPDASRVGPNLVASVAVSVLVIGYNEYKAAIEAVAKGESLRATAHDVEDAVLRPIEDIEEAIAEDVADDLKEKP